MKNIEHMLSLKFYIN